MGRFPGEQEDLELVHKVAQKWGYGNCINYLQYKWAEMLLKNDGISAEAAARGALMSEHDTKLFVEGKRL